MSDNGTEPAPSAPTASPAAAVDEPTVRKKGLPGWVKVLGAVAVVVVLILAARFLPLGSWFFGATRWIQGQGAVGVVVYILLYAVAALVGGATPLTLAAGIIYGLWGVAIVSPASVLGATLAFVLGRSALRKTVESRVGSNKKFAAVEEAVGKNGFKIVTLLRLSPIFPFTLLNYGLGLTSVKLWKYVLASFVGMLPGTLMYVYFGVLAGDLASVFEGKPTTSVTLMLDEGDSVVAVFPQSARAVSEPPGWLPEAAARFLTRRKTARLKVMTTEKSGTVPSLRYAWDFGDGTVLEGPSVAHQYKEAGALEPRLTVFGDGDQTVATASASLEVKASAGVFDDYGNDILLLFGLLATVVVTVVITRIARNALSESLSASGAPAAADSA